MGASAASPSSENIGIQQSSENNTIQDDVISENSTIQVDVMSEEGKLQHRWSDAFGGSTIADLRERLRTESRLANGRIHCKGRVLADSETLGSLTSMLVEKPGGKKVFDLSLTTDSFKRVLANSVSQTPQTQVLVEVSSSAGDLVSSLDATSETTVVELNIRLQMLSHGFQKLFFNGRTLADFETLGSLCTNSDEVTMSKVSLQSVHQESFVFAFECSQAKKGNIKTTLNIEVDQITNEILDRFATPDPKTFYTEESHSWLLEIFRGEYSAVLASNPEHAERLMAMVSSPPADVKVLRHSQGKIYTGLRKSTNEVLISGHRLMLLSESRVEVQVATALAPAPAPALAPAPPRSQNSYTNPPLAEKTNLVPSSVSITVITIYIQTHDDMGSNHVSCQMLSGEEVMSSIFSAKATFADLELEIKSTLNWPELAFLSENGMVNVNEQMSAYSTLSAKKVSVHGIDRQKCRRCGSQYISVQRRVDWCKMNGDAGGTYTSWCKTCGLELSESWSDD